MTGRDRDKLTTWEARRASIAQARPVRIRPGALHLRLDDSQPFDDDDFCRAYAHGLRRVREAEAEQIKTA